MTEEGLAPRRKIAKERDLLLPILAVVALLALVFVLMLRYYAAHMAPRSTVPVETFPAVTPAAPPIHCGRVNDAERCVPHPAVSRAGSAPRSELRVDGNAPVRPRRPAENTIQIMTPEALVASARKACDGFRDEGDLAYRQCEATRGLDLHTQCLRWRGQLNVVAPDEYARARALTDAYCEAERRYQIVK